MKKEVSIIIVFKEKKQALNVEKALHKNGVPHTRIWAGLKGYGLEIFGENIGNNIENKIADKLLIARVKSRRKRKLDDQKNKMRGNK